MANNLTRGAIADIIDGNQPEKPVLQILSMKKIPSGEQERFRLLVSDGLFSSSFAMLATQLNSKVNSGEISNFCVAQMDRYVCNTVQENKKVLIILEVSVITPGEEVGSKLGEPKNYDPNKPRAEQEQNAPNSFNAAKPASKPSPATQGSGPPRNPLVQRNVPSFGGPSNSKPGVSPSRTPNGSNVHPIASLTPYQNRWTICVRVTNKSTIRTWSNSRGEGKLFSMDLLDESGEIRATAFNEQLDKFFDMIEMNKVYFITGGTLKTANKQYSSLNNDYELTFNRGTEITPCHESTAIPSMQYSFVSLDQLESTQKDSIVDVIGICKDTLELSTVTARATGKELKKRDIQIVDDSNREVRVTLWGATAENFDGSTNPVMAVKGAKVSDFNGVSLSLLGSSSFQLNPDITESHKLRGWYDNGGNKADTVNLSNQRGGGVGGMNNVIKTFAESKLENLGGRSQDQADYYTAKATVAMIRKENSTYPACPQDGCNKKVLEVGNNMFRCEKCNREFDTFNFRLMLSVNLVDMTDNLWVTLFQDQAETLLSTTGQEVGTLKDTNEELFNKVFADATFKNYNFRIRVKTDTYNDETRLKSTVAALTAIAPKEYNRRLITEIKEMASV